MKPQEEKSEAHINLQPKNMEKNTVQLIMMYDIAGYGTGEIAEALGMTQGRVSVIKNSPLFIEQRNLRVEQMKQEIMKSTVKEIIEDPARSILLAAKEDCARMKVDLALHGKAEFVRNAATSEILAIGGIIPQKQNDKNTSNTIVLEEKMARRFGFALGYKEPTEEIIERTITIKEEKSQ